MRKFIFLCFLVSMTALAGHAQPSSGGPTQQAGPMAVPLDGGASLLLAGGAAYGLRRLRQRRA
ncbi:MAG: hypothetical protein EOO62_08430 [Hymenobacter sp.]|nr:MAG: hypothetical protein EOO62_08430 [Hymenobacter sp.]